MSVKTHHRLPPLAMSSCHAVAGQPLSRYGGFLFLYVVLILLFCEWQNLYRGAQFIVWIALEFAGLRKYN